MKSLDQKKLISDLIKASEYINQSSKKGYGNFMIVGGQSPDLYSRKEKIEELLKYENRQTNKIF